jgi:hypothetical protein
MSAEIEQFLEEMLRDPLRKNGWIEKMLSTYLKRLPDNSSVCILGPGNCLELVFLRKIIGEKAFIYAIDTDIIEAGESPRDNHQRIQLACLARSSSISKRQDYQDIKAVLNIIVPLPSLILCRNPRIAISASPGQVEFGSGIIEALADYAQLFQGYAQILYTTLIDEEYSLLSEELIKRQLSFKKDWNHFAPLTLAQRMAVGDKYYQKRPDGLVIYT